MASKPLLVACLSLLLGAITYFVVGIGIARLIGQGRFYSVPFGGFRVGAREIVFSVLSWIGIWALILVVVMGLVRRKR